GEVSGRLACRRGPCQRDRRKGRLEKALSGRPASSELSPMTAASLALIGATIVVSSFISGVFGMAGGMVLLGVLLVYFDVATGMVLFSLIQLATNGWRS